MSPSNAERDAAVIEAYEQWNGEDVEGLVATLPVSQGTLYSILHKHRVPLKGRSRRPEPDGPSSVQSTGGQAAKAALMALVDEVAELRSRVEGLEAEVRRLTAHSESIG